MRKIKTNKEFINFKNLIENYKKIASVLKKLTIKPIKKISKSLAFAVSILSVIKLKDKNQ